MKSRMESTRKGMVGRPGTRAKTSSTPETIFRAWLLKVSWARNSSPILASEAARETSRPVPVETMMDGMVETRPSPMVSRE